MSPLPFTVCPDCQWDVETNWTRHALEAGPCKYRKALYEFYNCEGPSAYLDVLNYLMRQDKT